MLRRERAVWMVGAGGAGAGQGGVQQRCLKAHNALPPLKNAAKTFTGSVSLLQTTDPRRLSKTLRINPPISRVVRRASELSGR
eukprot:2313737-Rhodomonas_salina.1